MTTGVWVPSRIVLISRGRHDEAVASANVYPGMLLGQNSSLQVAAHAVEGGGGPLLVAEEDALRGGDITQVLNSGDAIPFRRAARGDLLLMLLQNGQNVAANTPLMSAGDGTLEAALSNPLYLITAPSSGITNTVTATTFSNGSYTFPANFFQAGDAVHIRGRAVVSAQNSTNTHDVKVLIGAGPTTLFDAGALALAATQYVNFDFWLTIRTIGSSGTMVADGNAENNAGGTVADTPISLASTSINTTLSQALIIQSTASAASTGNVIALQEFQIDITRANAGTQTLVYAQEAINNSSGTGTSPISGFNSAAFIRCMVP
jgi:hypothetical protein